MRQRSFSAAGHTLVLNIASLAEVLLQGHGMHDAMNYVFFLYLAATWSMFGIIWFAQMVHYPLFSKVGKESFTDYQNANLFLTVLVVIPLQGIELLTAILLVWKPPAGIIPFQTWTNLMLIGITWLSTATLQVPSHMKLARGYESRLHNKLVMSNWLRTVVWTIRGGISFWMLNSFFAT